MYAWFAGLGHDDDQAFPQKVLVLNSVGQYPLTCFP